MLSGLSITIRYGHSTVSPGAEVLIWRAPEGEPISSTYQVPVSGIAVPVHEIKSVHGGEYAFINFGVTRKVKVEVTARTNGLRFTHGGVYGRAEMGDGL
jgi:hypothetical protein